MTVRAPGRGWNRRASERSPTAILVVASLGFALVMVASVLMSVWSGPAPGFPGTIGGTSTIPRPAGDAGACAPVGPCSPFDRDLSPGLPDLPGAYQPGHQTGWSQIASPPTGFGVGGGMISDSVAGTAVVFGGANASVLVNSTIAYSESNDSWWNVSTQNAPSPRTDFAFALDPNSSTAVLFGGETNLTTLAVSNATWSFNLTSSDWSPREVGPAPPARDAAAFALAPSLGIALLFGGWNQAFSPNGSITYSDLWELNLSTYSWTPLNVTGARPPPLEGAAMTWDPSTQRFELYGGCYPCSAAVWQFDPGTRVWTELAPAAGMPPARSAASWSYDPTLGADLLFGGTNGATAFGDTYLFYPQTDRWLGQTLAPQPSARSDAAFAFLDVPGNETWLIAGGLGASSWYSDLWRLSATTNVSLEVVNASAPGTPLGAAGVNLSRVFAGVTNASGSLFLPQVNAVGSVLTVSRFGYFPSNTTLWFPPGSSPNLTVALRSVPPGTVSILVTTAPGVPVPAAELNLTVDGVRIDPSPLVTAADGMGVFYGVVPGFVYVTDWLAGLRPGYFNGDLSPGGQLNGTILAVPDPLLTVTVYGRLSDAALIPLEGAVVLLDNLPFGITGSTGEVNGTTSDVGFASVTGMASGYGPNLTSFTLPWTGPVRITIVLPALPYGRLFVSVFRLDNDLPISGALVNATSGGPLPGGLVTALNATDQSGLATLAVPEGDYVIRATANDYFPSPGVIRFVNASSVVSLDIYLRPVPRRT